MRTKRLRDSKEQEAKRGDSGIVSDAAVAIGAATVAGYAIAYAYESGYCGYFRIPTFLITPTPSVIVSSLFAVVAGALVLAQLVAIERTILQGASLPPQFRGRLEFAGLLSLFALGPFGFTWSWVGATAFFFFIICNVYLLALLPGKGTLLERIAEIDTYPPSRIEQVDPWLTTLREVGPVVGGFLVALLMACFAAQSAGAASARMQKDFHVWSGRPDVALIRSYGDVLIGIKFEEQSKRATGEVVVLKIEEGLNQIPVTSKRIGPLRGEDRQFMDFRDTK
jgi:hypothetical protein